MLCGKFFYGQKFKPDFSHSQGFKSLFLHKRQGKTSKIVTECYETC